MNAKLAALEAQRDQLLPFLQKQLSNATSDEERAVCYEFFFGIFRTLTDLIAEAKAKG